MTGATINAIAKDPLQRAIDHIAALHKTLTSQGGSPSATLHCCARITDELPYNRAPNQSHIGLIGGRSARHAEENRMTGAP